MDAFEVEIEVLFRLGNPGRFDLVRRTPLALKPGKGCMNVPYPKDDSGLQPDGREALSRVNLTPVWLAVNCRQTGISPS